MKEDFLHFLWRTRRFAGEQLATTKGEPLEILQPGEPNPNAGPDFLNARIRIGATLWAGNVEIHRFASEWKKHAHSHDPAYSNVILHVVWEEDQPVFYPDGSRLPCLTLKNRTPAHLISNYEKILNNEYWIPCQQFFNTAPEMTRSMWLERLMIERLEQKTEAIAAALTHHANDWEEIFYQQVARNFGLKINAEPFEALARSLPQQVLAWHRHDICQIEALLFGQAGFLEEVPPESYPLQLQKEYRFLRQKYNLVPINPAQWRFLRLHPGNFPTVRLAQFARLVQQSVHLFSKILEVKSHSEIEKLFSVKVEGYWLTHYTFGQKSASRNKSLGREAIRLLTINTIVPFLFLYGKIRGNQSYKNLALRLLEELPPENNAIIRGWEKLGVQPNSAYISQALLQLKNHYCDRKKCLSCAVGAAILR